MELELTPQQREIVYLEESYKREDDCESSNEALIILSVLAAAALAGLYFVSKAPKKRVLSIDSIYKAYSGLSPDELVDR